MASYTLWKIRLEALRQTVESLRPEKIQVVGPWLLEDMAAYSRSPAFYRRRRAECLCSALVFKLIGIEAGRDHSSSIQACLADCRKWRLMENPAPIALKKAA